MGGSDGRFRGGEDRAMGTSNLPGWLIAGVLAGAAIGDDGEARSWTFEGDEPGSIAKGFRGEVGRWEVVATPEGRVLAQKAENPDATFNVALASGTSAEGSRPVGPAQGGRGEGGPGGRPGLAGEGCPELLHRPVQPPGGQLPGLQGGRRQADDVPGRQGAQGDGWRSIRVVMKGDHIECYLDGSKRLDVRDSTFPDGGAVGLWSKADAQSHFDDLKLRAGAGK